MKICFSGSTKRSEKEKIKKILQRYNPEVDIIVHGVSPKGGIDSEVDKKPLTLAKFFELSDREKNRKKTDWKKHDSTEIDKLFIQII